MKHIVLSALVLSLAACQKSLPPSGSTVQKRLDAQITGQKDEEKKDDATYVAYFETSTEADDHADAVAKAGGTASRVEASGKLLKVTTSKSSLKTLSVPSSAALSLNTRLRIAAAPVSPANELETAESDPAQAFLTARSAVGVDSLLARVPEADGRGQKVAVFDTGIDFGVEGLSNSDKLQGFYDFTGFGVLRANGLDSDVPAQSYDIDGKTVTFGLGVAVEKVFATGTLSEADLAKNYLWGEPADLNGDGEPTTYPYLIGQNRDGVQTVWIDADGNGVIENVAQEELADFNTSHRHIDLAHNTPSGAHPLAVTITGRDSVQFHAIIGGHGTSCSIIIAGDGYAQGRLVGMAPKAKLFGYVLDVEGQDVYTIDQFLQTFAHAKAQGVDAISISWGFSTADLASARFIGNYLDKEIASAGIVIGIAAGNGGPAMTTAAADDYIPHHGFAVGAHISAQQALNVYGWTGITGDTVVHYSSIGPTLGGRQVPDVVSPISTLVRGERSDAAIRFYGFSGTSSATPALIGAVTSLSSALKASGEATIIPRLIKLAIQQSAAPVEGVFAVRQGAGLINVDAAFDIYKKLAAEQRAADADASHRAKFAYELRAETFIPGEVQKGEGLHFKSVVASSDVKVVLTPETKALVDRFTFVEPLTIVHSSDFFQTPNVLSLQADGATFVVRFDAAKLARPGTYTDIIELKRADGITLLRVPVVVESPAFANTTRTLGTVSQSFGPFEVWRQPVTLTEASAIRFDGVALDLGGNRNARAALAIASPDGRYAFMVAKLLTGPSQTLNYQTPVLPAGTYELLVYRTFPVGAALGAMNITGSYRLAGATAVGVAIEGQTLRAVVKVNDNLNIASERLSVNGVRVTATLDRKDDAARVGYYGAFQIPDDTVSLAVGLRQAAIDQASERFQNLETTILRGDQPVSRSWVEVSDGQPLGALDSWSSGTSDLNVVAYPNIVNWQAVRTRTLWLDVDADKLEPTVVALDKAFAARDGQVVDLVFPLGDAAIPASGYGVITLKAVDGTEEKVDVRW